jgi:hypothetical protein
MVYVEGSTWLRVTRDAEATEGRESARGIGSKLYMEGSFSAFSVSLTSGAKQGEWAVGLV